MRYLLPARGPPLVGWKRPLAAGAGDEKTGRFGEGLEKIFGASAPSQKQRRKLECLDVHFVAK